MIISKVLIGKYIYLRTLNVHDVSNSYLSWTNDPNVNRYLEIRFNKPRNLSDLRDFVIHCEKDPDIFLAGIFLNTTKRHIGNIKLGPINRNHKVADLGFLIGEKTEWGKGYTAEAIALLANFALMELGLSKITAGVYEANIGSQKALIKAGFVLEGRQKSQWSIDDMRQDNLLFGRLKESVAQ